MVISCINTGLRFSLSFISTVRLFENIFVSIFYKLKACSVEAIIYRYENTSTPRDVTGLRQQSSSSALYRWKSECHSKP